MPMGIEQNTDQINVPGVYQDPQSKKVLEVSMEAGADALVRMGWVRIGEYGTLDEHDASIEVATPKSSTNDVYGTRTTKDGNTQYTKNGILTSRAEYEANVAN